MADNIVDSSENELDSSSAVDADVDEDDVIAKRTTDISEARKKNKKKKRNKGGKDETSSGGDGDYANAITHGCDKKCQHDNDNSAVKKEEKWAGMSKTESIQKAMELLKLNQTTPKNMEDAKKKDFQFWDTQPVPKLDEDISSHGPIEEDKPLSELRQEPYTLPTGFVWDSLDITNTVILKEVYTLLNENYVEDDDNMFRFDYSPEFLHWALQPPGWRRDWHIGVRVEKSSKLVGFISGVPAHIRVYNHKQLMVEINFLCVHKKLRSKRVAPVLIREVTRRVNCCGIFQAVYTAGVVLPKPVSSCRYWHRSLNPRKLIDVKFSHLSRNMTMQRTLKLYKLPDEPRTPGFRKMTEADIDAAHHIVTEYLKKFDLAPVFDLEEFKHWFLPRTGIIDTFVVENKGKITDLVSFYSLPSTVMNHPVHKTLRAAYSFYNVATDTSFVDLIQDALVIAKSLEFDVFNALDLMENKDFLDKLKFGVGDGNLQYYLYNWKCPYIQPEMVGLVLQ